MKTRPCKTMTEAESDEIVTRLFRLPENARRDVLFRTLGAMQVIACTPAPASDYFRHLEKQIARQEQAQIARLRDALTPAAA
ncbi:hypothetical protein OPIT5_29440 [Opitutaceae bacterium TAV5]|nr:hypothetical protein OPIT5_29440 [Opitutaceae bacterium TAV5]